MDLRLRATDRAGKSESIERWTNCGFGFVFSWCLLTITNYMEHRQPYPLNEGAVPTYTVRSMYIAEKIAVQLLKGSKVLKHKPRRVI